MWSAAYQDEAEVAALQAPMQQFRVYLQAIGGDLTEHCVQAGEVRERLEATLHHGLAFTTWDTLKKFRWSDVKLVELVFAWFTGALAG